MKKGNLVVWSLCLLAIGMMMSACAAPGPSGAAANERNPKLSSQLNDLVKAQNQGKAASFAQEQRIELVNARVRVIIESVPGQMEAARKAASAAGDVETSYDNLLQVLAPVTSLTQLAEEPSIRFIRLPQAPQPARGS
ncbi:MAG: hypothetical protein HY667_02230 [Chloroflexi bacterium]|nr:hypothetical protein [Chloroflexota bacterium]